MLDVTDHQGNADEDHNVISPHICQNGYHQKTKNDKCWQEWGERESCALLFENVNWHRHYGKQYGDPHLQLKITLLCDPAIPLLDIYLNKMKTVIKIKMNAPLCSLLSSTCYIHYYAHPGASQVAQMVKNMPAIQETQVSSLDQEDPLEKCREPARGTPLMAKVMRKEARHMQRWDLSLRSPPGYSRASTPKKPESAYFIALCSHLWLYWGMSPTTISLSLTES